MSGTRWYPRIVGIAGIAAIAAIALTSSMVACKPSANEAVAYTSVDQVFSEPIFHQCEKSVGISVRGLFDTEETKSTGVLNRLIAEADHPQADVFWSGDPVRTFVLVERGLVEPYVSKAAEGLPASLRAEDGTWTGFAARARVLLVNTDLVDEADRPTSIRDLADPKWKGRTAIANPLFGTTTMHVAALFAAWGDEKAKAFMRALEDNDVRVASSNGEVKRLVAAGEVAFGLTDTDDANEALGDGAHVAVVYPDQGGMGSLVMPTTVVLIKGAPHPEQGKKLIDCLLSAPVEQQMAERAAHMPLRAGLELPPGVPSIESIEPMKVDYAQVAKTMEEIQPWLRDWVGV